MSATRITAEAEPGGRLLRVQGRPEAARDWARLGPALAEALRAGGRVRLEIDAGRRPWEALRARDAGAPSDVVEAAVRLRDARRSLSEALAVRAIGRLAGPLLSLALSADLLVAEEGMAGEALFWEDSRLLVPGELTALAERVGRGRVLEHALRGAVLTAHELGLPVGESARRAWEAFAAGSRTAQAAAAWLLRCRARGRAGAEALERVAFARCFADEDRAEGVDAFRARREPQFPSTRTEKRSRGSE